MRLWVCDNVLDYNPTQKLSLRVLDPAWGSSQTCREMEAGGEFTIEGCVENGLNCEQL